MSWKSPGKLEPCHPFMIYFLVFWGEGGVYLEQAATLLNQSLVRRCFPFDRLSLVVLENVRLDGSGGALGTLCWRDTHKKNNCSSTHAELEALTHYSLLLSQPSPPPPQLPRSHVLLRWKCKYGGPRGTYLPASTLQQPQNLSLVRGESQSKNGTEEKQCDDVKEE